MLERDDASLPTASISPDCIAGSRSTLPEHAGTRIGPYTLVELIGEGGFGTVWLAQQERPLVRRVALKVIKPGMDTARVIARFEHERQTLARMDHPAIAKVFDAGTTLSGRPYFVMELVAGESITAYCDRHALEIGDRLELMARVCDAVQHAHAKGVIHRDLKPSNVLVERVDGRAMPRVIDFGIARAVGGDESQCPQFTQDGAALGTPEYMSPEQAAGDAGVDTRTDVYALGAMLYELLCGCRPFFGTDLRAGGLHELQRVIREVEPPKPSDRLRRPDEASRRVAVQRGTKPEALRTLLKRELEWVPLRAMRKERDRRYQSASELASDIRRYLRGDALQAGPESRVYLARKLIGRNRVIVSALGGVALAIVAGALVSLWFAMREREARIGEARAKQIAVVESQTTKAVNEYLVEGVLTSADPDEDGVGVTVETVLGRAADALDERLKGRPEVHMRVAATLGQSLVRVGRPERGREVLEKAKALAEGAAAGAPGAGEAVKQIDQHLGEALYRQSRGDEAVAILNKRLDTLNPAELEERAGVLNQLGGALKWSAAPDFDGAEAAYREALRLRRSLYAENHLDVLIVRHNLVMLGVRRAQAQLEIDDPARAALYERTLADLHEVLRDTASALGDDHSQTLAVRVEEARLLRLVGRLEDAERAYVSTIGDMRRVLSARHWRTLETLGNYSLVLRDLGKHEERARVLEEATEGYRWLRGPTHGGTVTCAEWLSEALEAQGCLACAVRVLERVHRDLESAHETARCRSIASKVANVYGRVGNRENQRLWEQRAGKPPSDPD